MTYSSTIKQPLRSLLWGKKFSFLNNFILVTTGSIVLAAASQLSIPLQPVPITLQGVAVIFIGMVYGWRLSGLTVALYLLEGVLGLPVFANFSCGLPILLGPTGGYLLGFIPAAIVSGWLMEQGWAKNFFGSLLAAVIGSIIIFTSGVIVLSNYFGIANAYLFGVKPFLLIDPIKLIVLAWFASKFWR
jgi:biotin transport system substrate-specific component